MRSTAKVSVAVLCYNQVRFIAQALDGALAQVTSFPYEIVVADDWSSDGTQEIIADYGRCHPDRIRILPRSCHLGMGENWIDLYSECRGEYVAYVEGDDFWTSPYKLQKQVDLLDARPDLALCHHRVAIMWDQSAAPATLHPPDGAMLLHTVEDLLRGDCMVTCSTMLRRRYDALPAWCVSLPTLDWPTFVLHALHGGIGYLPEPMAVYRQHSGGVWSSLSRREKLPRKIEVRRRVAEELGEPYGAILAPVIERLARELAALQMSPESSVDRRVPGEKGDD